MRFTEMDCKKVSNYGIRKMIRRFETRDLNEIMDLWLHANIESHSFIEADYWKKEL